MFKTFLLVISLARETSSSLTLTYSYCGDSIDQSSLTACNAEASNMAIDCTTNGFICVENINNPSIPECSLQRLICDTNIISVEYSLGPAESCSCDNFYYQRCSATNDCQPGFCCSSPSFSTVQLGGHCGPPSCVECDNLSPGEVSVCEGSEDCSPLFYGTCIADGTVDNRPGYACANDPCYDLQEWAESTCGYHRLTNTFGATWKRCSTACLEVIRKAGGCPNLKDMVTAYQNTPCNQCADFFYQRCQSTSDCPVGYCCSLPPDDFVPGFFDETTCGPPESCECKAESFDSHSFAETITCSEECGPRELGICEEIGSRSTYNAFYSCDCTDPVTFERTGSPTATVTFSPTIQSSGAPSSATHSPTTTMPSEQKPEPTPIPSEQPTPESTLTFLSSSPQWQKSFGTTGSFSLFLLFILV